MDCKFSLYLPEKKLNWRQIYLLGNKPALNLILFQAKFLGLPL